MINITNESAAREARRLAQDLTTASLSAFSQLPEGKGLTQLLAAVGVCLRAEETRQFRVKRPHETVELITSHKDMAGPDHERAVRELTEFRTADLHDENSVLTAESVATRRHAVHTDLTNRREKLSAPLRMISWLPSLRARAEARRSEQYAEQVVAVATALSGVPLPGPVFDEVFTSALSASGLTAGRVKNVHEIKAQSLSRHREFSDRWETVLMLAWEAIATEEGGAAAELVVESSRRRFGDAKTRARQIEEDEAEAQRKVAENRIARERTIKQAKIAREIEVRRKWEEQTRLPYDPDHESEHSDGLTYHG